MTRLLFIPFITLFSVYSIMAQQKVGINTDSPFRTLDLGGSGHQYMRIHSTSGILGLAGFEMVRATGSGFTSPDWRIVNDNGTFKIQHADDNFSTSGTEALRISTLGNTGIGTTFPISILHLDGGTQVHNDVGYLTVGNAGSSHLSFDNNSIQSRIGNTLGNMYIQPNGGSTYFGSSGGDTYMVQGGGHVGIGTTVTEAPLSIDNGGFQLYLRNQAGGSINDWYIGASNPTWVAGDDQLLFSPTSSSADAVLRLMDVTENDGNNAPVMIYTNDDHTILMDGNEIDTRNTPLYVNYNTQNETYINPSGGKVGIGNNSPDATLHVVSPSDNDALTMQRNDWFWTFDVQTTGTENFLVKSQGVVCAQVSGVNGQWMVFSDARKKENVLPMPAILDKIMTLPVSSYKFKHDPKHVSSIGIMAQDLQPVFPEIVKEREGNYGVEYSQLAVIALKAIQEQQQILVALREKLAQVKAVQQSANH